MGNTRKSFTTAKGTELPLLSLKGKEYLQVAHRLVWFREAYPTGILKTTMLAHQGAGDDEYCVFKTEVYVDTDRGPLMISTGHKKETRRDFPDFMEKCETGSIGRALALAGFGTQFTADELNEGERLADAPLETPVVTTAPIETNGAGNGVRRPSFRKNISAVSATTGDDI